MSLTLDDALHLARSALARREGTAKEIGERLARAGFDGPLRDEALARLAAAGQLSDARFATERARSMASRGYGDAAVTADLRSRGVADDLVVEAVAGIEPELDRARRLAARRSGGRRRLLAQLGRKGFTAETLERIAGAAIADDRDAALGCESTTRHLACIDDTFESEP